MTSYEVETFNGSVTGYITIAPIEGSTNRLEGLWEVVPTLEELRFYAVKKTGVNLYNSQCFLWSAIQWTHSGHVVSSSSARKS